MAKVFWWAKKKNFGDLLAAPLLKRFSKIDTEWSEPHNADLVLVGSILEQLTSEYSGIVAGVGKLHESSTIRLPKARILALRGPLSAKGIPGNYVLADPALLADELVRKEDKEYNLGLIPHWTDTTLEQNPIFKRYNPKIIRVSDDPLDVIREIGRCKKIVSSSLHGIILADAFGIPRRIEIAPRMLTHSHQEGGLFKWNDYSASIEMKLEIGVTQTPSAFVISQKQHELYDVFKELKRVFK